MVTMLSVDKAGRVVLPKKIRERLGLVREGVLLMEMRGSEVVLKRSTIEKSPSMAISKLNLPIATWEQVEKEIEEGITME